MTSNKLFVGIDPGLAATGVTVSKYDAGMNSLTLIRSETFEEKLPPKTKRIDDFWEWPKRSSRQWQAISECIVSGVSLANALGQRGGVPVIIGLEDFHVYRNVNKGAMDTAKFVGYLYAKLSKHCSVIRLWTNPHWKKPRDEWMNKNALLMEGGAFAVSEHEQDAQGIMLATFAEYEKGQLDVL